MLHDLATAREAGIAYRTIPADEDDGLEELLRCCLLRDPTPEEVEEAWAAFEGEAA